MRSNEEYLGHGSKAPVELWVAAALAGELAGLRSRLRNRAPVAVPRPPRGLRAWTGVLSGRRLGALCFGVGADSARRGARWLQTQLAASPEGFAPPRVLLIGLAGALDPTLRPLQQLGVRRVCEVEPTAVSRPVETFLDLEPWGEASATCITVPHILCTREEKQCAWSLVDRVPGAVVDLETAAFLRELRGSISGLRLSSLRVVSDSAEEELPEWMTRCVDRRGALSPPRVALTALGRPLDWGSLLRLRRRLIDGARVLSDAVEAGW